MNRFFRRLSNKQNKKETVRLSKDTINEIKNKTTNKATERTVKLLLGLPIIVLNDKFDFTKEQLEEFNTYLIDTYDAYEKDYITLEDIENTLYEEVGIKIVMK